MSLSEIKYICNLRKGEVVCREECRECWEFQKVPVNNYSRTRAECIKKNAKKVKEGLI